MNAPLDMSRFIEAKSDQLNADDLMGGPRTITVTRVSANDGDQPVNIYFAGDDGKPFRPCKTIRRVLVAMWGADASKYVGRSMTIYRDPNVQFGGMQVGGTRISHMSHIEGPQTVVVMKTKGKKAPMKILPLATRPAAQTPRSPAGPATQPGTGEATHGDGAGASPNGPSDEETAEWNDWVMDALAGIAQCDRARLAKWQARKASELAHLEEHFPNLHRDVLAAIADRNAALDGEAGE